MQLLPKQKLEGQILFPAFLVEIQNEVPIDPAPGSTNSESVTDVLCPTPHVFDNRKAPPIPSRNSFRVPGATPGGTSKPFKKHSSLSASQPSSSQEVSNSLPNKRSQRESPTAAELHPTVGESFSYGGTKFAPKLIEGGNAWSDAGPPSKARRPRTGPRTGTSQSDSALFFPVYVLFLVCHF
jgi:hypothetical protein